MLQILKIYPTAPCSNEQGQIVLERQWKDSIPCKPDYIKTLSRVLPLSPGSDPPGVLDWSDLKLSGVFSIAKFQSQHALQSFLEIITIRMVPSACVFIVASGATSIKLRSTSIPALRADDVCQLFALIRGLQQTPSTFKYQTQ